MKRRQYHWWMCNHCGESFPKRWEHEPRHVCRVCRRIDWKYDGYGREPERCAFARAAMWLKTGEKMGA